LLFGGTMIESLTIFFFVSDEIEMHSLSPIFVTLTFWFDFFKTHVESAVVS
jgi:hypothetical protein